MQQFTLKTLWSTALLVLAVMVSGGVWGQYTVNFEGASETKTAYASGTVSLSSINWDMTEALIGTDASDWKNGNRSARMRGYGTSSMTMLANKSTGAGIISFSYRRYGTDTQVDWRVEYSTNEGESWTQIGSDFTAPANDNVQSFSEVLNVTGNIRIRIKRATESGTSNRRLNIDDITITDYTLSAILSALPNSLNDLSYIEDEGPSDAQSFSLSGTNLNGTDVTISAPEHFAVSDTEGGTYGETVTLTTYDGSATNIWVRLQAAKVAGDYSGNVGVAGGGATAINVAVSGSVTEPFSIPYENEFRTQANIDLAVAEGFEIDNANIEAADGGYIRIYPNGYIETPSIDFTDYNYIYVKFDARTYGGALGQTLSIFASVNNGADYSELSSFTFTDSYLTYGSLIDLTDALNSVTGKLKVEMTAGTGSTRFRDFAIYDAGTNWTGVIDSDWANSSNWTNEVPQAYSVVSIQSGSANYPTISVAATVENIVLQNGATILDNNNLTINGTFTMQRTIANDNGWHLIAAPTTGMAIVGSDFVPAASGAPAVLPTNFDFYSFLEGQSELVWNNIRSADSTPNGGFDANFVNGKGYLVAYADGYGTTTFDLTGTLNTGNISSPTLSYTGGGQQGWNLIGNPYPSSIDWSAAAKGQFADIHAYIYNENKLGGEGYEVVNGTIAPNQGFFVELNEANNGQAFEFTNAIRVHGGTFLKSEVAQDAISLRLGNEVNFDETRIKLHEEAGFERERQDARKLFSFNSTIPQLFTQSSDGVHLSINAIPQITEEAVIELGIRISKVDNYYLSLTELGADFEQEAAIYLKDAQTGSQQNLLENDTYYFTASPDDSPNRFLIHFGALSIDDNPAQLAATAYVHGGQLYILNGKGMTDIRVLDVQGRLLQSFRQNVEGVYSTGFNLPAGMYIIQLQDAQGVRNNKVIKQ